MASSPSSKPQHTSVHDHYEVKWDQTLGEGLNGHVYVCYRRRDRAKFALKCLSVCDNARREVEMHVRCSGFHNVVTVHEVFETDIAVGGNGTPTKCYALILEFMAGGELYDRVCDGNPWTEERASKIMRQIGEAVRALHSSNIAHRDIKPENLLFTSCEEDATLKLSDFGFAKVDNGNLKTPVYSATYAAPQVLTAQQHRARYAVYSYDKSCDMWSVGVIMYILLCGYPPFRPGVPNAPLTKGMIRRIQEGQYEFAGEEWSSVSSEAKQLIGRLLCVDSDQRMKIDEFVKHPWIQGSAPATPLPSQANIEAEGRSKLNHQLSSDLSFLRQRHPVVLNPVTLTANPIAARRQQQQQQQAEQQQHEEQQEEQRQ